MSYAFVGLLDRIFDLCLLFYGILYSTWLCMAKGALHSHYLQVQISPVAQHMAYSYR